MDLILKKTDRGNLATASQRWLAPNAFHTIIKQPSIYVNGTLTTEQTDTYAYKAYLETVLNYGTEGEETILRPQGYYSALNHPPHDLTVNQIVSATPHANYTALSKKRKKAVEGRKNHSIVWVTSYLIPGSREYIDFTRSYFRMDLILKKTDRGNLATASQRWLAPNAFHTIIKQPSIYVNGTLTTEQTDTYAYKAYLETVLNYGTEGEETILRPQGYYSALNHPPHDLTVNQIVSATPHANYTALSKKRKKAVEGRKNHSIVWVTSRRFVQYG